MPVEFKRAPDFRKQVTSKDVRIYIWYMEAGSVTGPIEARMPMIETAPGKYAYPTGDFLGTIVDKAWLTRLKSCLPVSVKVRSMQDASDMQDEEYARLAKVPSKYNGVASGQTLTHKELMDARVPLHVRVRNGIKGKQANKGKHDSTKQAPLPQERTSTVWGTRPGKKDDRK